MGSDTPATPNMPLRQDDMLALPRSEYRRRIDDLQARIREAGLAGWLLFDPEGMFWLTGYQTIGYFTFQTMYVPRTGEPVLVSRIVNRDLALAHPTVGEVVAIADTDDPVDVLARFLRSRVPETGQVGIETRAWYLTVDAWQRLNGLAARSIRALDGLLDAERMVKNEDEIERIRRAARAAEAGLAAAIETAAPGRTDNDIAAAMMQANIAAGSEYLGHPPLVVAGHHTALCFAMWRRRTIRRGDVILLEAAGCVDRYHAMLSRPVVVGRPEARHVEAAEALQGILEAAVASIRPGDTAAEVDRACRATVQARGFGEFFRHRAAYGIGIGFPPNWSEGHIYSIRPGDPLVLRPNMTFHVIPTLFLDDFGMCFSDSVRVTADGCEVITSFPRKLFVAEC